MKDKYCVYKHTSPSGKVYIGITCQTPAARWRGGEGYKRNTLFYRAILKYGWANFRHEILFDGLSKAAACDLETALIKSHDSMNPQKGYNNSKGGECGTAGLPAWNKGLPSKMRGRHMPDEQKRIISAARTGKPHPHKGCVFTDAHRANLSSAHAHQKRAVRCVETGQVYASIREAETGTGIRHIGECCRELPKCKTAGGYHWKFE
jgi:hypothetical protein